MTEFQSSKQLFDKFIETDMKTKGSVELDKQVEEELKKVDPDIAKGQSIIDNKNGQ